MEINSSCEAISLKKTTNVTLMMALEESQEIDKASRIRLLGNMTRFHGNSFIVAEIFSVWTTDQQIDRQTDIMITRDTL